MIIMKVSRVCLTFLLILSLPVFTESVSIDQLLEETGSRLLWEPILKKGMLIRGTRSVTFSTEYPLMILDDATVLTEGAVLYSVQGLTFSQTAAGLIKNYLLKKQGDTRKTFRIAGILIDPGHGGRDSGAVSSFPVDGVNVNLKEKNLVLEIGLRLEEMLRRTYPDKEILMTRKIDIYPTLENRVKQANDFSLDKGEGIIYISIHGNASLNSKAEGFEVWYLPENYRRDILDSETEGELAPILNTLLEEEFTLESKELAESILLGLNEKLGEYTLNRGIKEESWFVVRNAMMASILVETGFISNREETERLRDPQYLKNITDGIYNGIIDFVDFFEK